MFDSYLNFVTINTGHNTKSYAHDLQDGTITAMRPMLDALVADGVIEILDSGYQAHLIKHNNAHALFAISQGERELIRLALCLKSRYASTCWQWVKAEPISNYAPFLAVWIDYANCVPADMQMMSWIADFERCLAWAYIDKIKTIN